MVIDCFPFFNELDLLEVRLNELSDIVDVFFLCEATLTHNGTPKKLFFEENKDRFAKFLPRIRHIVLDDYSGIDRNEAKSMERYHKQYGLNAVMSQMQPTPNDVIILSDCDEIPRASSITEALGMDWNFAALHQPCFYYWMNCIFTTNKLNKCRLVRPRRRTLTHIKIRHGRKGDIVLKDAGWHFSFLGDIAYKVRSYHHVEYNKPPYNTKEHLADRKAALKDPFDRGNKFEITHDLSYLPEFVLANIDRFKEHIHA